MLKYFLLNDSYTSESAKEPSTKYASDGAGPTLHANNVGDDDG